MVIRSSLCPKCNSGRLDAALDTDELRLVCPVCGWDYYPQARPEPRIIYEEKVIYRDRDITKPTPVRTQITEAERRRITIETLEGERDKLVQQRDVIAEYLGQLRLREKQLVLFECLCKILRLKLKGTED
jgi:hypothetical protein